jgi:hypothetical protein
MQEDIVNMNKLLIILADKIDPYIVTGCNQDRDKALKEPLT